MRGLARVRAFFNAPVVIFHLNTLSYFSFLCLFAYVLMVDFQPSPSWCERLVYLWLFSLVCEELRQARPLPPPACPWRGGGLSSALPASQGSCRAKGPSLSPSLSRGPSCLGLGDMGTRARQAGRGFQGGPGDRALLLSGPLQELEAGWLPQGEGPPTRICISSRVRGQELGLTPHAPLPGVGSASSPASLLSQKERACCPPGGGMQVTAGGAALAPRDPAPPLAAALRPRRVRAAEGGPAVLQRLLE